MHLSIHYDQEKNEIIYDRKLKDGPGLSIYGIEVAKAMKLPDHVIKMANLIRSEYYDDTIKLHKSKYNTMLILGKCLIDNCQNLADDTHHIKFQSGSDCNGMIDNMSKDMKCNLAPLCKTHHNLVHNGIDGKSLIIHGYLKSGRLNYQFIDDLKPDGISSEF